MKKIIISFVAAALVFANFALALPQAKTNNANSKVSKVVSINTVNDDIDPHFRL